jgi:hypothetical protein
MESRPRDPLAARSYEAAAKSDIDLADYLGFLTDAPLFPAPE